MKQCRKCMIGKPFEEFHRSKASKDGRQLWCKSCAAEYQRNHYNTNNNARDSRYRLKYGLTLEDFNRLLEEQGNVCKLCGKEPKGRSLHADHNHVTGEFRGIICNQCNVRIGWLKLDEGPDYLFRLAEYAGAHVEWVSTDITVVN